MVPFSIWIFWGPGSWISPQGFRGTRSHIKNLGSWVTGPTFIFWVTASHFSSMLFLRGIFTAKGLQTYKGCHEIHPMNVYGWVYKLCERLFCGNLKQIKIYFNLFPFYSFTSSTKPYSMTKQEIPSIS